MKPGGRTHPDNLDQMLWPGCFRCHDGKYKTADGRTIKANDCNACHTILARGNGAELQQLTSGGQPFKHVGGDYDLSGSDCHASGLLAAGSGLGRRLFLKTSPKLAGHQAEDDDN